jgi:mono/diheme cytochrome c family protein
MSRGGWLATLIILAILACALVVVVYARTYGFSAKAKPSRIESAIAHRLLDLSYPTAAKTMQNPLQASPVYLAEARHQYKEQCAFCHGDDGAGKTEAGRGLYPKAANLRHEADMSDGQLFYIMKNGIRFTGMPGWDDADEDIWKMVLYIRDLPNQKPSEQPEAQAK